MVDFEQGLRIELQSIAGLSKKIYPLSAPEGTNAPYIVYSKSSTDIIKTLDGNSKTRSGVYDIDILSNQYNNLQSLFMSVKEKLNGFIGRYIGGDSVYVQNVTYETILELYEPQVKWYRMSMEVRFYFEEA